MTSERDTTIVEGLRGRDVARDFAELLGRLQALQGRIERAVINQKHVLGALLNGPGDSLAML